MKKEAFRQHQTIFKAGDQASKVYLLARGSVGIFLPDNDSKEPNFLIPESEIFGEMGVIDDELRMADARAMEDSELVSLTKDEFEKIVSESNIFVRAILGVLSERLRQAQKPKTM
jgi:CRP/FNR family cyclic AMP-dependent transcriptional regulator